ncbi:hypothetical protein PE067_21160 [Paracoccus sp. DMF-8]|uniref:hypothetical protein n=1 Tax=Paracoccus sp. DMF-8 TaxID=3019445 RepID=UPI0023E35947|nr:hypothetical protein [Paracoccus sp. DMF-8]MDF3608433.1 hypothetical protein [Paracoccus sp. DMF-8]
MLILAAYPFKMIFGAFRRASALRQRRDCSDDLDLGSINFGQIYGDLADSEPELMAELAERRI